MRQLLAALLYGLKKPQPVLALDSSSSRPSSLSERNLLPPGPPVLYWRV
jgi:hypothetical protein